MVAFFLLCRVLLVQVIGHEQHLEHDKHDEQFRRNDCQYNFCPPGKVGKTVIINRPHAFKHNFFH